MALRVLALHLEQVKRLGKLHQEFLRLCRMSFLLLLLGRLVLHHRSHHNQRHQYKSQPVHCLLLNHQRPRQLRRQYRAATFQLRQFKPNQR